jgi:predicted component of type VI protein secretion system
MLVRPFHAACRRRLICLALVLTACTPVASAPQTGSEAPAGLPMSSWGVCAAMLAVPDTAAAQRSFTNLAHSPLHSLAADPRLSRAMSARILETMGVVEADFGRPLATATLADDLATLHTAVDGALRALGLPVPKCAK